MFAESGVSSQTARFSNNTAPFEPSIRSSKHNSKSAMKLYSFNQSEKQYQMTFGENPDPILESQLVPEKQKQLKSCYVESRSSLTQSKIPVQQKMKVYSTPNEFPPQKSSITQSQAVSGQKRTISVIEQGTEWQIKRTYTQQVIQEEQSDEQDRRVGCLCFMR